MSILTLLKNDAEYYGGIGKQYLSNSSIGDLLTNPANFGKTRDDSKALAEGRYFHQLLLEPEKAQGTPFVDVSTRTTKEYKNFCEERNMPFVMLKKEQDDIQKLVDIMRSNIQFYDDIYDPANEFEVPAVGEIMGLPWKGKADIVGPEYLIDLKTTSDIQKFKYSSRAYNYDSQCYIYQQLFGKPLVFYVIDKLTGVLGIFRPTENFLASGEAKVAAAVEVYNKYFGKNSTEEVQNFYIDLKLD